MIIHDESFHDAVNLLSVADFSDDGVTINNQDIDAFVAVIEGYCEENGRGDGDGGWTYADRLAWLRCLAHPEDCP